MHYKREIRWVIGVTWHALYVRMISGDNSIGFRDLGYSGKMLNIKHGYNGYRGKRLQGIKLVV